MSKRNPAEGIPCLAFTEGDTVILADLDGQEQAAFNQRAGVITEQAEIISRLEWALESSQLTGTRTEKELKTLRRQLAILRGK